MNRINGHGWMSAKKAMVKYESILDGQFPEEFIVTIHAHQGQLTAIFPSSAINKDSEAIIVAVIDEEEDRYLVDLPTYTFTTGSKVWFAKDSVILAGSSV